MSREDSAYDLSKNEVNDKNAEGGKCVNRRDTEMDFGLTNDDLGGVFDRIKF